MALLSWGTGRVLDMVTTWSNSTIITIAILVGLVVFAALLFLWPRGVDWMRSKTAPAAAPSPTGGRTLAKTRGGSFKMRDSRVSGKDTDFDQQGTETDIQDSEFE